MSATPAPSVRIEHRRIQHPVGQGGFHSGYIRHGRNSFNYVYDCGSGNLQHIFREVKSYTNSLAEDEKIDLLALSHLDSDHVSGLDWLLFCKPVDVVLLPYLAPDTFLYLLAAACATGRLTASYLYLLLDPVEWLKYRGVQRVYFVSDKAVDPDPREEPRPSNENQVESENQDRLVLDVTAARSPESPGDAHLLGPRRPPEGVFLTGASLATLTRRSRKRLWNFIPCVYPEPAREPAFVEEAEKLLKGLWQISPKVAMGDFVSELQKTLQNKETRRRLGLLYRYYFGSINKTSLSLYSGPMPTLGGWHHETNARDWSYRRVQSDNPSWIGTGDAELLQPSRLSHFLSAYGPVKDKVGTIMIPHHGSRKNSGSALFSAFPGVRWVVPHGQRNSYRHPHKEVILLAELHGAGAVSVTEDPATHLIEVTAQVVHE